MTIREELKKLVAKLGGTPSKDDQTAELIHKVTDNVSGGGGIQTIKPVIGEFVQNSPNSGSCSFTITGLKYNSLYILDFDYERDVSPLLPSEDWHVDERAYTVSFYGQALVWYTWNGDHGAWMVSIINSEQYASNAYMSPEEGETFTAEFLFAKNT